MSNEDRNDASNANEDGTQGEASPTLMTRKADDPQDDRSPESGQKNEDPIDQVSPSAIAAGSHEQHQVREARADKRSES